MSKPSKKAQSTQATPPPAEPQKRTGLVLGAVAFVVLAIGVVIYVNSNRAEQSVAADAHAATPATAPTATSAAQPAAAEHEQAHASIPPPAVLPKAHPQKDLPPLQMPGYALGRSPEVITAAYRFAAEHPEILTYIPCFCGCERMGHHGNEDCFVKARAANGDVVQWEDHGMECNVCLDVATQAMQMHASGASVRDIRAAVEAKWTPKLQSHTPTPDAPK